MWGDAGDSFLLPTPYSLTPVSPLPPGPLASRPASICFSSASVTRLTPRSGLGSLGGMTHSSAPGAYRHIVLFQFKADAPAAKVRAIVEAFAALPAKLPAVKAFEHGTNVSPEGLDQGFSHIFTLTFASKQALEQHYLHEPAHQEFVAMLGGVLEKALVVDYVAG